MKILIIKMESVLHTLNHRENVVLRTTHSYYFRHPKYTHEKSEKNKNISHITYSNMLFKAKA